MSTTTGMTRAIALCGALMLFGAGCSTMVTINSDPAGAMVYSRGSGRSAYKWACKGKTPVSYDSYYNAEWVRVVWPDGSHSKAERVPLLLEDKVEWTFKQKPGAIAPRPQTVMPKPQQ